MKKLLFFLIVSVLYSCSDSRPVLTSLLEDSDTPIISEVLKNKDKHRLQVIYTQIDRDAQNEPHFTHHGYNVDDDVFFNPASMVKLPAAIFALEKLNRLDINGLDKYQTVKIDSNYHWQTADTTDVTSQSGLPSIAHYIKRAILVSENDPYNRLYQFVGLQELNDKFKKYGFTDSQLSRQFLGVTRQQNTITNSMTFYDGEGEVLYRQEPGTITDSLDFSREIRVGKAHMSDGQLINEPIDFSYTNRFSLQDLQGILQMLMFPDEDRHYNLTDDDYSFLYQCLSQYPGETSYPKYDKTAFAENYVKLYFGAKDGDMPSSVRVFNKVGWAYGFLTDVSYVIDFDKNIEYMLSSTIYVNENETLNDDIYEYETVGRPFLSTLGSLIYDHEVQRKRDHAPNLDRYRITYDVRDEDDGRPPIKSVYN